MDGNVGRDWEKTHNQGIVYDKIYFQLKGKRKSQTFKRYNICIFSIWLYFPFNFFFLATCKHVFRT